MTNLNKITLVTVSDNHYLMLLAALIKSIESNLDGQTQIDLSVVHEGITKSNISKLERSINPDITKLQWLDIKDIIHPGTKFPLDYSTWPTNIYFRLFIPGFIKQDVKKVLFMDVDMINCRDINELWQTDLKNNIVGAVQDSRVMTFDNHWGGIINYKELGLPGETKYFNSGILLIDTEKWCSDEITQKTIDCINNNRKFSKYPDQYGLNIVLKDKWLPIDPAWNQFAYEDTTVPYNIHFIERKPCYKTYNSSAIFRNRFYYYLNQTEWRNTKSISEPTRYMKKLNNVIRKAWKSCFEL